jgi:hypothetical protein
MSARHKTLAQQHLWADRQRLAVSAAGYLDDVAKNLRAPLSKAAQDAFSRGSGSELRKRGLKPAKMCAVHSSAALAVNFFDFWTQRLGESLARAFGMKTTAPTITFEEQFPTGLPGVPPNVDVVIRGQSEPLLAIESKFTEWMTPKRKRPAFKDKYFPRNGLWKAKGLPECQMLAERIQKGAMSFRFLDAPQLLKHMLGLATAGQPWRLLYLYFDCDGPIAEQHRGEIKEFGVALGSSTPFAAMTYQHLLESFANDTDPGVVAYRRWLSERYFDSTGLG